MSAYRKQKRQKQSSADKLDIIYRNDIFLIKYVQQLRRANNSKTQNKKMGKIELTNIIIDDFSIAKRQTNKIFTHILTHIHTDHLKGLVDGWSYGPIYCTQITKRLVLQKYPSIQCIHVLELQKPTTIKISPSLEVTVTFFDANHCFGAVVVLLQGYMGTVLYTGDFRFDKQVFQNYNLLYPPEIRNTQFVNCSRQVDLLYLDNTFLKKKFDFPKKAVVQKMTLDFIKELLEKNQHTRIYIALDIYGKEQLIEYVAKELDIYIVVDEIRYDILRAMGRDLQLYTTNFDEGFIQIITKRRIHQYLEKDKESICFVLSGWANHPSYRYNKRIYCLPYSLHSNYQEIHSFVNSIRPSYIQPIVFSYPEQDRIFYADREFNKRLLIFEQESIRDQRDYFYQLQELRKLYCSTPSEEYKILMTDIELQKNIMQKLLPPKMLQFSQDEKQMMPIHLQTVQRKKYKLKNQRNQAEINRLRNQILLKKKIIEGEKIEIIQDEDVDSSYKKNKEIIIDQSQENIANPNIFHDELIIDQPEIVQLDPFDPFNPVTKPVKTPKKRNSQKLTQQISLFNKSAQDRFLQKVRRKLREQQKTETDNSLPNQNLFRRNNFNEKQKHQQKPMPTSWITSINLDNIQTLKMLSAQQELKNFFQNNKKAVDFISSRLQSMNNK